MGPLASPSSPYAANAFGVNLPCLFFLRTFLFDWCDQNLFELYLANDGQDGEGKYRQQEQDEKNESDHHGYMQNERHLLTFSVSPADRILYGPERNITQMTNFLLKYRHARSS